MISQQTLDRNSSVSPSRRTSFGNALSALGAKITRTLSRDEATLTADSETRSISTIGSTAKDRSQSRGRDVYQSSGRGGAGNIRQTSLSRDARPAEGPDDFSIARGREPLPAATRTFSTGRGGMGNIRSPSRDPATPDIVEEENDILNAAIAAAENAPHSSGRGGAGNISRSRSRGPTLPIHSTGRGGVGNMVEETVEAGLKEEDEDGVEEEEEEVRRMRALRISREQKQGEGGGEIHSTGRGGSANLTSSPTPGVEHAHAHLHSPSSRTSGEHEPTSTGRGGVGNIVRDSRERSRSAARA